MVSISRQKLFNNEIIMKFSSKQNANYVKNKKKKPPRKCNNTFVITALMSELLIGQISV